MPTRSSVLVPTVTMVVETTEEWRLVTDADGLYEVSNLGRVRRTGKGPIGQQVTARHGFYAWVVMSVHGKPLRHTVHSIVMAAFVGPRPPGAHINHLDGWRSNNDLRNLEYCTPKQNTHHNQALKRMRFPRGTKRGQVSGLLAHPSCPVCAGRPRLERREDGYEPRCNCGWVGPVMR